MIYGTVAAVCCSGSDLEQPETSWQLCNLGLAPAFGKKYHLSDSPLRCLRKHSASTIRVSRREHMRCLSCCVAAQGASDRYSEARLAGDLLVPALIGSGAVLSILAGEVAPAIRPSIPASSLPRRHPSLTSQHLALPPRWSCGSHMHARYRSSRPLLRTRSGSWPDACVPVAMLC